MRQEIGPQTRTKPRKAGGRRMVAQKHSISPEIDRARAIRPKRVAGYTTRIIKGGALLPDMRLLTAAWDGSPGCAERMIASGPLSHMGRKRAQDVLAQVFIPRFVRSKPPDLWRPLQVLEGADWSLDRIRPIHYYAAAKADPLFGDVVSELLQPRYALGQIDIDVDDVLHFLEKCPKDRFAAGRWSEDTARRVAQGLLSSLRDFGVLTGAVTKRLAAVVLPIPTFALLARARHEAGVRGLDTLKDPTWRLFYLSDSAVEHFFVEAQQHGLLKYHAAGSVIRVDYPEQTLEDYARTLTQRAH